MDVDSLVENNMGLVWKQLHRFRLAQDDDAISFAMEGLWKAAKTYNGTSAFSTYATACVYNALAAYLRQKRAKRQLILVSYDVPLDAEDEGSDTVGSLLSDYDTPEEAFLRSEFYNATTQTIKRLLDAMKASSKKKPVIQAWYDTGGTLSQQDLAKRYNVSQSYVSRIISEFKHKVMKEMEDYM